MLWRQEDCEDEDKQDVNDGFRIDNDMRTDEQILVFV